MPKITSKRIKMTPLQMGLQAPPATGLSLVSSRESRGAWRDPIGSRLLLVTSFLLVLVFFVLDACYFSYRMIFFFASWLRFLKKNPLLVILSVSWILLFLHPLDTNWFVCIFRTTFSWLFAGTLPMGFGLHHLGLYFAQFIKHTYGFFFIFWLFQTLSILFTLLTCKLGIP